MKRKDYTTLKMLGIYLLAILTLILFSSCGPKKPDFVKDGKEYDINQICIQSHTESTYGYHWGYNYMNAKYEWHMGWYEETICDEYKMDTVEINLKKKYYANKN